MFVRILEAQEILPALHLVWDVFAADVAPYYEPAGVAEFQKFIKYENVMPGVSHPKILHNLSNISVFTTSFLLKRVNCDSLIL